jgi:hypothetical protein
MLTPLGWRKLPVERLRIDMNSRCLSVNLNNTLITDCTLCNSSLVSPVALFLTLNSATYDVFQGWLTKKQLGDVSFRRLCRWIHHHR